MEKGELLAEPELHLDTRGSSKKPPQGEEWDGHAKQSKSNPGKILDTGDGEGMEEDAFFGDDDDDESE